MFIKLLSKENVDLYLSIEKIISFNRSLSNPNLTYVGLIESRECFVHESSEEIMNLINEQNKINKEEEKIKRKRSVTILNDEE